MNLPTPPPNHFWRIAFVDASWNDPEHVTVALYKHLPKTFWNWLKTGGTYQKFITGRRILTLDVTNQSMYDAARSIIKDIETKRQIKEWTGDYEN